MRGLRIHVAGSATYNCDRDLAEAAHRFVSLLTDGIVAQGGGLVVGAGGEPRGSSGEPCIFDWTALSRVVAADDPAPGWPPLRRERFVAVSTQSGLSKIPDDRREIWDQFRGRTDATIDVAQAGWRMAGIIRERQVERGDVLVLLGGGAGVEHLAQCYHADGKPVIPITTDLGAYSQDGSGGSQLIHSRAISTPNDFFHMTPGTGSASGRLLALKLDAATDTTTLAKDVLRLLMDLRPPLAFYVRLLATAHPDYSMVEAFFRKVVDPVVREKGYTPDEIGSRTPTVAFMNLDIFRSLHLARLVIVDLTGVRPNCLMEFGYALARHRRVIICAKDGTKLPFDPDKLPTHYWKPRMSVKGRIAAFEQWFDRYYELPTVIA